MIAAGPEVPPFSCERARFATQFVLFVCLFTQPIAPCTQHSIPVCCANAAVYSFIGPAVSADDEKKHDSGPCCGCFCFLKSARSCVCVCARCVLDDDDNVDGASVPLVSQYGNTPTNQQPTMWFAHQTIRLVNRKAYCKPHILPATKSYSL